jgi:ribonuclease P protein component
LVLSNLTFTKAERLKAKKHITRLFAEPTGSFFLYPIKFSYILTPIEEITPAQLLVSAPKRNFKRAHDRNRIKRQMREVYRKNKSILYDSLTSGKQQACFLLGYVGKEHSQTDVLEEKITTLFKKFAHAMAKDNT